MCVCVCVCVCSPSSSPTLNNKCGWVVKHLLGRSKHQIPIHTIAIASRHNRNGKKVLFTSETNKSHRLRAGELRWQERRQRIHHWHRQLTAEKLNHEIECLNPRDMTRGRKEQLEGGRRNKLLLRSSLCYTNIVVVVAAVVPSGAIRIALTTLIISPS